MSLTRIKHFPISAPYQARRNKELAVLKTVNGEIKRIDMERKQRDE